MTQLLICIGLGGGYNERDNVEYVEREESDDEYDQVSALLLLGSMSVIAVHAGTYIVS